jgi:hypothetical protein
MPAAAPPLRHVRAAQLRARVLRRAIWQLTLGTLFLIGALTYGVSHERNNDTSQFWMTALTLISSVHVGSGLRLVCRVKRWSRWLWVSAAGLWAVSLVALLRILVRA